MNETIKKFLGHKEIAIAGVSTKDHSWGKDLMKELHKGGYNVYPINPKYNEVEGVKCYNSPDELPENVENLIIAVKPETAVEIVKKLGSTKIKRVWLNQGIGQGAFSEEALNSLKEQKIEYVYGFCPMMFFGSGLHKFHFWMRKNLGKTPADFSKKIKIEAIAPN